MRKLLLIYFISLLLFPCYLSAQGTFRVEGKVLDEKTLEPLIGAVVMLQATKIGTATDAEGNYSIEIPNAQKGVVITLDVSYVGYRKISIQITLSGNLVKQNISLTEDILQMQTVVVTGTGTAVEKQKLGNTIGHVSAAEVTNSKALDVISAIQGKVANVEITQTSGEPGASTYIRIRGANSITGGTQPLMVVDGSPINNQEIGGSVGGVTQQNRATDINPKDIESISILKGASAAALYGSRALNGVVLITTKSGKPGKTKVSYDVSYSYDDITQVQPLQQLYGQGNNGVASKTAAASWGPLLGSAPTFNHERDLFQTGHNTDNNLTVSGGNERTTYYFSAGRSDVKGTIIGNSRYQRNSVRLKASQLLTEQIKVTGNFQFNDVSSDRIQRGSNVSGLLLGGWRTPPDFDNSQYIDPVTGWHRSYRVQNPTSLKSSRGYDNPFFVAFEHVNKAEVGRAFGNIKVDYDPFDWLNFSYILGHDYTNDERRTVLPPSSSAQPDGLVTRDKFNTQETDGNFIATAKKYFDFADMAVTLSLGQNLNQRKYNQFTVTGTNMAVYGFNQLDNTSSYTPDEYESTIRSESYMGNLTVEMFNQLYLTAGIRNDGSSTFGESEKRHWYPKFSGAWEFTKLDFFKDLSSWFDFGKLRSAYGESGQEPGVYTTITSFGSSSGAFGDGWGLSFTSNAYGYGGFYTTGGKGQKNILPQRAKEIEVGLDLGFLNDRLGIEFTYYNRKTTDAIFSLPLPPSTGNTSQVQNAGIINNRGIELSITTQPINISGFKWDLGLIYATNKNEVLDLSGAEYVGLGGFTSANGAAYMGFPLPVIRGYDYVKFGRGVVYSGVDIDKTYSGWKAGDLYIHTTGYPVQDPQIRIIGDPNPDWTGSVRSTFTLFGEIELSALLDFKQGGDVWNGTLGALTYFGTSKESEDRGTFTVFNGYGPGAGKSVVKDQAYYQGVGSSFVGPSSSNMEDGSYVKLREISIAYTLRSDFIKEWTGLSSIDLRVSARNLKTWTNYKGIDPETNLTGGTNLRGLDYFNNPQTRSIVLSLRLNY